LDQITFRLPVPIGAVLRLTSKIVKTSRPGEGEETDGPAKCHVMVKAEVEDYTSGERKETNTFSFTLEKHDDQPLGRTVVPQSYLDAMNWLEGKRRLEAGASMRRLYQKA
jgi:acyl-coenzyme A thioesterase 9